MCARHGHIDLEVEALPLAQGARDIVEGPGADDILRTVGLDERRIFGQAYVLEHARGSVTAWGSAGKLTTRRSPQVVGIGVPGEEGLLLGNVASHTSDRGAVRLVPWGWPGSTHRTVRARILPRSGWPHSCSHRG